MNHIENQRPFRVSMPKERADEFVEDTREATVEELALAWALQNITFTGNVLERREEDKARAIPAPLYLRQARALKGNVLNAALISMMLIPDEFKQSL